MIGHCAAAATGRVRSLSTAAVLAAACIMAGLGDPATAAQLPKETAACQRAAEALNKQAERLEKSTRIRVPREFVRVAANLDDYCEDKEFQKARISLEWMETCIKNYRRPYNLGYCMRSKKYFCAVEPASEGCTGESG